MRIVIVLSASIFFFSCKKEANQLPVKTDSIVKVTIETPIDSHNSQNTLDYTGTYKGIIPCADCEGIETEIILNQNFTYEIKTKYLGKGDGRLFEEKGHFVWDVKGSSITLEGLKDRPSQYKVGESQLIQLDMKGKAITGALSEKYVLIK